MCSKQELEVANRVLAPHSEQEVLAVDLEPELEANKELAVDSVLEAVREVLVVVLDQELEANEVLAADLELEVVKEVLAVDLV